MPKTFEGAVDAARKSSPGDISGALAMRQNGFTEAEIELVFGYVPPNVTRTEFLKAFADDLADDGADARG